MPGEVILPPVAPALVTWGIAGLAVFVALAGWWSLREAARRSGELSPRAVGWGGVLIVGWLAFTWSLAAAGLLARFDRLPPPAVWVLGGTLVVSLVVALSPVGRALTALPWAWLVGLQAFRLPLEWVMAEAADAGVMPVQMSFHGWNFDVVTGLSAVVVAAWAARGGRDLRVFWAWNLLGAALLVNIVTIAVASTPMVRAFGEDHLNTWVFFAPFVWLPTVLVATAIIGHIVIARKLLAGRG